MSICIVTILSGHQLGNDLRAGRGKIRFYEKKGADGVKNYVGDLGTCSLGKTLCLDSLQIASGVFSGT